MKWTTKKGEEIKVSNMTLEHAQNVINILIRNNTPNDILNLILYGNEELIKNTKIKTEFRLNGDIAQQWNDMNEEHDFRDDMTPWKWV